MVERRSDPDGSSPSSGPSGRSLSQYELLEKIEGEGDGEIYLARDTELERRVVLRLLPRSGEADETDTQRYLRGARAAAALDHPYIGKIYETGLVEGRSFIVTEYVRGPTLAERLRRGGVPLEESLRIASEIAEALEAAHAENIIHRDLKPANVVLAAGDHVKLMGFGVSRTADPRGSPAYLSPEQIRDEEPDTRSDIFSLGTLLYEVLTGVHPFRKNTAAETAAAILQASPNPLARVMNGAPHLLEHVLRKLLAGAPSDRYQLVREARIDLSHVRSDLPAAKEPDGELPATTGPRKRWMVAAGAALLGLLALGALWGWFRALSGPASTDERPSVAVLPLVNESDDPLESDYLAEGISKAVITRLVQAGLRVTPWETAVRYRDRSESSAEIARALNVSAVLTGTFQLVDFDTLFTTLSLLDAESGLLTWSEEFQEPYEDLFDVQRRIALGAATSLRKELTGEEAEALAESEFHNLEAYDYYLQGAYIMQEPTQEASDIALEYFTLAVEIDESLVEAHVGLGSVKTDRYYQGWWAGASTLEEAEASYERALELNPESLRARRGLASVYFYQGRFEDCLAQGELASRYGRADDVETLLARAEAYFFGGLPDRAIPFYRQIIEIDPLNQGARFWVAQALTGTSRHEETMEAARDYIRRFGEDRDTLAAIAFAHMKQGHVEYALESFEKLMETPEPLENALIEAGLYLDGVGRPEGAEEVWRRAVEVIEPKLEASPDNGRLSTILASLYGLLGEQALFLAEKERALAIGVFSWETVYLAVAFAKQGETDEALEFLRRTVLRQGLLFPFARDALELTNFPGSEVFDDFVREFDVLEERLREKY